MAASYMGSHAFTLLLHSHTSSSFPLHYLRCSNGQNLFRISKLAHRRRPYFSRKSLKTDSALITDLEEKKAESVDGSNLAKRWEQWAIKVEQRFNIMATESIIFILDLLYSKHHYARFYVLETIARVPYFAFVSVLHMYESFGWWRRSDYLKVHFAESWNELHHLLIMEALGGDKKWIDRFLAQHIAVAYYFLTVTMYIISPRMAYHFSECVERHAYSTYDNFINEHGEKLKNLPAPEVALEYYTSSDLYMFDEFQTHRIPESRRPRVENLYDVFINIREDEGEHCKTMKACQTHGSMRSPHSKPSLVLQGKSDICGTDEEVYALPSLECAGIREPIRTDCYSSSAVQRNLKASNAFQDFEILTHQISEK